MNTTLNLVDHVLAMGRRFQDLGRHRDALNLFTRLSGFRELASPAAEETQIRLAELHLRRRRYCQARRHLTAALRHQPDNARYHYLMATAWRAADQGNLERAAEHYQRSLELQPEQQKCAADYGLLLIRLGRSDDGLSHLRQAVERSPGNADILGKLVKGLRQCGRGEEARSVLQTARFRNSGSPRFRKLWNEFQFQQLRQHCEAERLAKAGITPPSDEPVLLPFPSRINDSPRLNAAYPTILRHDEASAVSPPHLHQLPRRPGQRYVQ